MVSHREQRKIMAVIGARTPLTYYGGKQQLANQIVPLFPRHRVYLEPFAGGAAVLFAKRRVERETLNDMDGTIVRFWRVLRDRPQELAAAVAATPYSREEWESSRELAGTDDIEAARMLLVNIDQSFSRSRRSWSVPCIGDGRGRWQPGSWANLPPKILAAAERLSGVALEHGDALQMIPKWDRSDAVIYLDPPYEGTFRLAPGHGYNVERSGLMADLLGCLRTIRHAAVFLSGYPCAETAELEAMGWASVPLKRRRTVQSRAGDVLPLAPEVIWANRIDNVSRLFPIESGFIGQKVD
jgi:DNA adenine methylase